MKSSLNILVVAALALQFSVPAHADFVGLNIGATYWSPGLSGSFNSASGTDIDLSDDLDIDDPSPSSLVLSLEHPVPFLPNIRYQGIDLDSDGSSTLSNSITFEGQTYAATETVRTTFDLSHDDIVLYYEILDNWVNLDVGLDLKRFDGEVSVVGSTNTTTSSVKIDETLPLLYLSARFDLPFSGFYVGADLSSFSIDDSSADELTVKLGYESGSGLGIEGGVKTFSLELDDADDLDTDIEYDGAFVNGYFHF
ncbi:MAG: TIGR04219 family outer membrane beta-barrel protein [Gammaproteobacteria bacterium]|nr:TIGR04219 family outer membrane beta-barrel protein [Gammaproteobacteria bacterium]